jgi:hypothetical protein
VSRSILTELGSILSVWWPVYSVDCYCVCPVYVDRADLLRRITDMFKAATEQGI